ncbi:MAG: 16S rRNA (adenine(1518)-N(6)/adenine(1519)-N(6))-dimethyltransferase RsmA [Nitrososphaerota archaeon]|nr:16S rRNA (adenine(1518)-N(6)/adenine(1519)-N(6))-dimethyltransferase RsmA [Candidatus Bathyarchaeota archaeon]MDW8048724.1 16S rRNA (adenine(1518)-N(6)/adenine(1519)-N(6))-dimethyltransferase RsmA [Nitrososphaerota archaeon]
MNLREEAQRIILQYRIKPRKRLGQHFLVEEEAIQRIISHASLTPKDRVLEIGAGLGFLTERLAEKAGHVIAVEIDKRLAKVLRGRLAKTENVTILEGDILKIDPPQFDKVVSTPPYRISSQIQFWILERKVKEATLTFQEEFAKCLVAPIGSRDYGRLTIATYYRAEAEILEKIPREMFWPHPRVDSVIVKLRLRSPPFHVDNEKIFFDVVRDIFTQKNRKLRKAIIPFLTHYNLTKSSIQEIADSLPFSSRRPRELSPEEIGMIADEIFRKLRELKVSL